VGKGRMFQGRYLLLADSAAKVENYPAPKSQHHRVATIGQINSVHKALSASSTKTQAPMTRKLMPCFCAKSGAIPI